MRSWRTLVVAAMTVPAAAYVVGEAVAEDPSTTSRSAVVLTDAAREGRDDDGRRTGDDRAGEDRDDPREARLVRPCAGALGDHDADDRMGPDDRDDGDDGDDGDEDEGGDDDAADD